MELKPKKTTNCNNNKQFFKKMSKKQTWARLAKKSKEKKQVKLEMKRKIFKETTKVISSFVAPFFLLIFFISESLF